MSYAFQIVYNLLKLQVQQERAYTHSYATDPNQLST